VESGQLGAELRLTRPARGPAYCQVPYALPLEALTTLEPLQVDCTIVPLGLNALAASRASVRL
jgi:hypothetical protein